MDNPKMTVIVLFGHLRSRTQRLLSAVAAQTVAESIELVVADLGDEGGEDLELPENPATRVIVLGPDTSWGEARAAALREAKAPVVAFIEDHCYPSPGWAEALLVAHRGPWAAVGYAFTNADPSTYISRAALVVDYGKWMHPIRGGPGRLLSYNNVSYKTKTLLDLDQPLEQLLATDFHAHRQLLSRGHRLYVESDAVAAHENYSRLGDLLWANHEYCRALAADRSHIEGWGAIRRLLQGLATPFVAPPISVLRLLRSLPGRPGMTHQVMTAAPLMLLCAIWSGVGESLGYILGGRGLAERVKHWEVEATRSLGP